MSSYFDLELIKRYDKAGPRYTSYPTAVAFHNEFTLSDYILQANQSNQSQRPLSLYFHIPFCDTVCFYCACNKIVTKDYTKAEPYLKALYQEISMQSALFDQNRIVEQLHFGGGTPTFLNDQQIQQLMDYIRTHFSLLDHDQGDYSIEIDPRSVSKKNIQSLRKAGFNRFSLGVQDINPIVQKAVNRIQPLAETQKIVAACREAKAHSVSIDLIYGLPLQTAQSFNETLEQVIETLSPDRLSIFNYAHLPHLFKPQRRINEVDLPSAEEKLAILQNAIERLLQAGYLYIGMDHFAKPNDTLAIAQAQDKLHRNFQGYTTHADCDLIAMGVSAISHVGNSYSQNSKEIKTYYQAIEDKKLPIIKGLILNAEDQLRAHIIQHLACHFKLNFARFDRQYHIQFQQDFKIELAELAIMQKDGLLSVDANGIQVSPAGRFLIRNICMVFDAYLRQGKAQTRFSKVI